MTMASSGDKDDMALMPRISLRLPECVSGEIHGDLDRYEEGKWWDVLGTKSELNDCFCPLRAVRGRPNAG